MAAIAEQVGVDFNTVSRNLKKNEDDYWRSQSTDSFGRIEQHKKEIEEILKGTPHIASTELRKILLKRHPEFKISERVFMRYIKIKRSELGLPRSITGRSRVDGKPNHQRNFLAHETLPGIEAQVDMGQVMVRDMYGESLKLYIFAMVMGYSRMKFFTISTKPFSSADFVMAHDKAFRFYDGQPKLIVYDQDRTMVVSENAGKIIYTQEFEKFLNKMDFDVFLCNKADPDGKGKIENVIKFIKYNFFKNYVFLGINKVNSDALQWLDEIGNGRINGTTFKKPSEMFKDEKAHLFPYKQYNIDITRRLVGAKVSELHTVLFERNRYSVPFFIQPGSRVIVEAIDGIVSIYTYSGEELIIAHTEVIGYGGASISERERSFRAEELNRTVALLGESEELILFLERMRNKYPRYILQQCRMLRKLPTQYEDEAIREAIKECLAKRLYHVSEIITILIARNGAKDIGKIVSVRTESHYKRRAIELELQMYDCIGDDTDEK